VQSWKIETVEVVHQERGRYSKDVGSKGPIEIKVGSSIKTAIKAEEESYENTRKQYVKTPHCSEIVCIQSILKQINGKSKP